MLTAHYWAITGERSSRLEAFEISPDKISAREILIKTTCSAVSPGTECSIYNALDPDVHRSDAWCRYPWRAGYSGVGEVLACGAEVREFRPGDRVLGLLGHASHWIIDLDGMLGPEWSNRLIGPVHSQVPDEAAAFVRLAGIAMTSVQLLAGLQHGTIGVWGLGVVGNLAAQLLLSQGHRVVGVEPSPERRRIAGVCGVTETLAPDDPALAERIAGATSGRRGLDAVVDTVGRAETTIGLPSFVRIGGRLVLLTHWRSQPVLDAAPFINEVFNRGLTVHGGLEYGPGSQPWESWPRLQLEKWAIIQRLIVDGRLRIDPLVTKMVGPQAHVEVYRSLCSRLDGFVGVIVDWRDEPQG
jgi:2-desacetyl-2-hydroxyethyl bacteriochlorophyllide A dehydrogenase